MWFHLEALLRSFKSSKSLKVLDALGFRYGPFHTELMLTPKGPRLIETAARPMGGFFPNDLMRQIFGFDHAALTLDAVLDPKAFKRVAAKPEYFLSPKNCHLPRPPSGESALL